LRDRLMEEVRALRSRSAPLEADAERHGLLEQELEAARSERDRLDAELQGRTNEVERLRAELREAQCARHEEDAKHRAAYGALERELRECLGRWEADRQELQADWQRAREAQVEDTRRRIRESRARGAAACRRLRGRLEVAELRALREFEAQQAESARL